MKFALIDGERREPQPNMVGRCPGCGEVVTAKCGTQRVWHWAHKGRVICDRWWEPETEWHRAWKNLFPTSWQEVPCRSEATGELHIADIRTPHGLVLEFQHSAIHLAERLARETFYEAMLWIVDGSRLKRDRPRMDEYLPGWRTLPEGDVRTIYQPAVIFPRRWIDCTAPVLFDFDGPQPDVEGEQRNPLICLLPQRFRGEAVCFTVHRSTLALITKNQATIFDWRRVHNDLIESEMRSAYRYRRRR